MAPLGAKACALAFDRSLKSIHRKAAKIGVSMRRRSLGDKWGTVSPAVLRRVRELSSASLCPACGLRFQGVKSSGLCGKCHLERLAICHEEELAKISGQRALFAARSKLYRYRRKLGAAEGFCSENGDAPRTMKTKAGSDPRETT